MSEPHSIREQWEREVKPLIGRQGDGVGLGVAIITTDFQDALDGLIEQYERVSRDQADLATELSVARGERDGLKEQFQTVQAQLHAEQRNRNWWAAENSRERQRLQEQLEAAQETLRELWGWVGTDRVYSPLEIERKVEAVLASNPASEPEEVA